MLWDFGTQVDEKAGIGSEQGPRQKGPNTGKAENGVVKKVADGRSYADAPSVMRVRIKPSM